MKKRFTLFIILFLSLCNCSSKNSNVSYHEYFSPIIEELENFYDVYSQNLAPTISTWWNMGISGGGKYADTEFICYINGKSYSFSDNNLFPNTNDYNGEVIGIFPDEITKKTFVIFHHFDVSSKTNEYPTLILLEFVNDNPSKYTLTPYESSGELNWFPSCYRIENKIYIAAADNTLAAINLNTHELSYFEDEYHYTNNLVQQYYAQTPYQMCQFQAVFQQNDIVVYSAFISEAFDITPVGLISVAYRDSQPIAYIIVDLTVKDLRKNLIFDSIK